MTGLCSARGSSIRDYLPRLGLVNRFFDAAARTGKTSASGIRPARQHQAGQSGCFLFNFGPVKKAPEAARLLVTLSLLGAAMLAQPPVTEVKKVVGFFHINSSVKKLRGLSKTDPRNSFYTTP